MKTVKQFTARKGRPVLTIFNDKGADVEVIRKSDGTFRVQGNESNKVDTFGREVWPHDEEGDFLRAYAEHLKSEKQKEDERKAAEEAAAKAEEERIEAIREKIRGCEDSWDFYNEFGLTTSSASIGRRETATCILIDGREDAEVIGLAIEEGVLKGEWGECHRREGNLSHGWAFSWNGQETCEDYAEHVGRHIGEKNFYRDSETEEGPTLERLQSAKSIEEARKILVEYEDLEPGYYGCGGDLLITNDQLNDPDFNGYSEDVHTYQFAFQVNEAESFPKPEFEVEVTDKDGRLVDVEICGQTFDDKDEAAEAMQAFAMSEASKGKEWKFEVVEK